MKFRRVTASLVVAAVIGAGAVLCPISAAEPAQAAATSKVDTWSKSLGQALRGASKLFEGKAAKLLLGGSVAAAVVGPLLSILGVDDGPSMKDVMRELGDIKNGIATMQHDLQVVDKQVRQTDVDALMGTCSVETSALTDLLTKVQTAQNEYDQIVTQAQRTDDLGDVRALQRKTDSFIQTVFGSGKTSQVFVDGTDLGNSLLSAHNRLITTGGSHGVIESCGKTYYQEWRAGLVASNTGEAADAARAGAWLDDRQYYEPLQDMVMYWQTVQGQGVYLLQQAAYLQAVRSYAEEGGSLSARDSARACASVDKSSGAAALCSSTLAFTGQFHSNIQAQWRQAGVPYSSDDVVLALGTKITGLKDGATSFPSVAWARQPDEFADGAATRATPGSTSFAEGTTFDGLDGWSPAASADWNGLGSGLVAAQPSARGRAIAPIQELSRDAYPYWGSKQLMAPFTPVDILGAMGAAVGRGGEPQFGQTSSMYWIPGETATTDARFTGYSSPSRLGFPSAYQVPEYKEVASAGDLVAVPRFNGPGFTVACMVVPKDGALCGGETVSSWWVSQQRSDYWVTDDSFLGLGSTFTARATWSVTPQDLNVARFEAKGLKYDCETGYYSCQMLINGNVSMAPWLVEFTDATGVVHSPKDAPGYEQRVWPVTALPTGPGCTTLWGAPSRCGPAMDEWLDSHIADPTATTPEVVSAPAVSASEIDGSAECAPPVLSTTGTDGAAPRFDETLWTAVDAGGRSASVSLPWGEPLPISTRLASAIPESSDPTGLSLTCSVAVSADEAPAPLRVGSAPVAAALVDGTWRVGVQPQSAVTEHPTSHTVEEGTRVALSASVAVDAPDDADEVDGGSGRTATVTPTSVDGASASPAGVTVQWEKGEGDEEWAPFTPTAPSTLVDEIQGPLSLGQRFIASELVLDGVDAGDHGDRYRAVFTLDDGTRLVSSPATVTLIPDGWEWVQGTLGAFGFLVRQHHADAQP